MEVIATDTHLKISLSRIEKLASLHGDVSVALEDVTEASVDEQPARAMLNKDIKRGVRVPGWFYLATADHGRHFIAVRRNRPALHLKLRDPETSELTVSTSEAKLLAGRFPDAS